MQSLFKTEKVRIDGIDLTIRELGAKDHMDFAAAAREDRAPLACSRCVVEWKDETVAAIAEAVPARILGELTRRIFALSGFDEAKNSEPTPSADSSSS